ncbi:hypothetical protein [Sphingobacterium sp. UBA6308]|uniref:hypothetical protein n=1 Tax=Sphingobacterium TaxID=28453 RepID=UPI0025800292|nr:hypothetical protein [Sphingobacterium sp. UBA6308]
MEILTINDVGISTAFNCRLEEGCYTQLYKSIKTKSKYSYSWNDRSGDDVDQDEVTLFESVTYSFSFLFRCNTIKEFNTKYDAFVNTLKAANGSVWTFTELDKTFRLHLVEITDLVDIDLVNGKAKVLIQVKNNWQL